MVVDISNILDGRYGFERTDDIADGRGNLVVALIVLGRHEACPYDCPLVALLLVKSRQPVLEVT